MSPTPAPRSTDGPDSLAEIDPEMANDPLLGEVGWSWLTEALTAHGAEYAASSGTVTKVASESFGSMSEEGATAQLEIRASFSIAILRKRG